MAKKDPDELVHYKGSQLARHMLPEGYDEDDVTPIDEWFKQNRNTDPAPKSAPPRHKAKLAPKAGSAKDDGDNGGGGDGA